MENTSSEIAVYNVLDDNVAFNLESRGSEFQSLGERDAPITGIYDSLEEPTMYVTPIYNNPTDPKDDENNTQVCKRVVRNKIARFVTKRICIGLLVAMTILLLISLFVMVYLFVLSKSEDEIVPRYLPTSQVCRVSNIFTPLNTWCRKCHHYRALSKCVNDGQTDWDIRLDQVLFSLRTKPQASTKYSPFFLLYGREAQYPSQLPASFGLDHQFPSCPSEDVIDEHIEEREQQQAKTHENVENNTKKAKEKQQKDFKKANEKKRTYVGIKVGDKVLKFNSARATRKSKADLATNYSGPYIVNEIVGQRCRIQSLDGKVLKSLVSLSNVKLFREPSQNPDIEEAGSSDLNECIKILAEEGTFEQVVNECMKIIKTSGCRPENLGDFAMRVSSCPVMSFVNEVLKTSEAFVDKVRDEILKVRTVREEGDFAGVLMLTSCVLAKAVVEKMSPMDVLETLEDTPVFLAKCEAAKELDNNERLTVAGEGIEKVDLNTLIGNNWLNDKVLNGYTKLLARESTDSMDFSSNNNRIFMIPSYTARLWDAGTYDNYLFKKVDFSLYNMIVVPWNINGNHWVVLVARTKESSVMVYDSLGGENSHLIDKFCLFMKKRSEELGQDVINWYKESPTTNQQSDGSSCGVFVLMTVECLVKGRTSWILRQAHVTMFRKYIGKRLLLKGLRNTLLCDSLNCKDPKGDLDWVMCDVCYRWLHKTCLIKEFMEEDHFQCGICDAQYF